MGSFLSAKVLTDIHDRCNAGLQLQRGNRSNNGMQLMALRATADAEH
jgi:hypothetical protein